MSSKIEEQPSLNRNTLERLIGSKRALYLKVGAMGYYLLSYKNKCITVLWLFGIVKGTFWSIKREECKIGMEFHDKKLVDLYEMLKTIVEKDKPLGFPSGSCSDR
jgi:hypothetical protein